MFEMKMAMAEDAELIAVQRCRMFAEMGWPNDERMQAMAENFVPWVRAKLNDGSYLGWLVSSDGRVVGGGGMLLMDFPPHWRDARPMRAYLLNFYVEPEFRGRGLAQGLLKAAVEEAKRREIKVVSLHASKFGKPLYERSGFEVSNEMVLWDTESFVS
jgi:GNAT superfamily N-acetyltransferase